MEDAKSTMFEKLRSPWAVVSGLIIGILSGIYLDDYGPEFKVIGEVFLAYMTMCTLPIIVSAIISSLGAAFRSKTASKKLFSMFKFIFILLLMTSFLTLGIFFFYGLNSEISSHTNKALGREVVKHSRISEHLSNKNTGRLDFLKELIPENIFAALSKGDIIGIIFFSIFLGIALGVLGCESSQKLIEDFDAIFRACQVMLEWGLYFLPLGIACLIASQFSALGGDTFMAIFKLCGFIYAVSGFIFIAFLVYISKLSGKSIKETLAALKEPLLIGISTQDSLLAIPSLINTFEVNFNARKDDSLHSTIPLTVLFCKAGTVIYLIAVTSFLMVFLDQPMESVLQTSAILLFLPVFLSFGDSGGGTAIYTVLAVILGCLDIPAAVAIPLLISFDFLFDPILIAVDIIAAATVTLFQAREQQIVSGNN